VEHQLRTIQSWELLNDLAPEVPWLAVCQGWKPWHYWNHVEAFATRGHDLRSHPVVGIGSVCRRQGTAEAAAVVRELGRYGLKLHGFGFKLLGLLQVDDVLASADSLAWSFAARRLRRPLDGCVGHKNCANCLRYALEYRDDLLTRVNARSERRNQLELPMAARLPAGQ
jgi:hypothetical protein